MLKDFYNWNKYGVDNLDINAIIDAIQPELDSMNDDIRKTFCNRFVVSADIDGILEWENDLNISADPETESPPFRKERILSRLLSNIPFTERLLQETMNGLMGHGNWSYSLDHTKYYLRVNSLLPGESWEKEIWAALRAMLPANIVLEVFIFSVTWQAVWDRYSTWGDVYNEGLTWLEAMNGL